MDVLHAASELKETGDDPEDSTIQDIPNMDVLIRKRGLRLKDLHFIVQQLQEAVNEKNVRKKWIMNLCVEVKERCKSFEEVQADCSFSLPK